MNQVDNRSYIIRAGVGVILIGVGILLFIGALNANVPSFWLSALVTLIGVITVAAVPTVGAALMGIGLFMLLRDFGIVETPWLGYIFSAFLVIIGLYGIFGGKWQAKMDERPRTK